MTHALLLAAMVVIRTYNYAQVPPADLTHARQTVDRTFSRAGISLRWVDCWVPSPLDFARGDPEPVEGSSIGDRPSSIVNRPSTSLLSSSKGRPSSGEDPACAGTLREGTEFVLRLMASPEGTAGARKVAMGSSLVDHEAAGGALITVDANLVAQIAQSANADFATLLGRSVAHEVGHLLLGHARHSRSGLMRAVWSQDELRGIRPVDWGFSRSEAAQMRQGLATRTRSAN
jgi:hypothetical protein